MKEDNPMRKHFISFLIGLLSLAGIYTGVASHENKKSTPPVEIEENVVTDYSQLQDSEDELVKETTETSTTESEEETIEEDTSETENNNDSIDETKETETEAQETRPAPTQAKKQVVETKPKATKPAPPQTQVPETQAPTQPPETQAPTQPPETQAPTQTQLPETQALSGSNANQVLQLVNQERAKAGLSALAANGTLTNAANKRATEIVSVFDHTRPNGSSFFTVLEEHGVSMTTAGENIAYGQRSPSEVVTAWMNSPGHAANILSGKFGKLGVGVYETNGTIYWVQLFTN